MQSHWLPLMMIVRHLVHFTGGLQERYVKTGRGNHQARETYGFSVYCNRVYYKVMKLLP